MPLSPHSKSSSPHLDKSKIRVGIIRSSSLGDVILASALLDLLSRLGVDAEVTWFGSYPSLEVLTQSFPMLRGFPIRGVQAYDQNSLLQETGPLDALIDLQGSLRSLGVCKRFQNKFKTKIYRMSKERLERLQLVLEARLRGRRSPLPTAASAREFLQFKKMLEPLVEALGQFFGSEIAKTANSIDAIPNLHGLRALKTPPHVKELEVGNWIAIAPGAAHDAKRAPPVLFARIMQMLVKDLNYLQDPLDLGFVFLGDEQDRKIVKEILGHFIGEVRYLNFAGRLNLWESALSLAFCKSLLCNDTALAHASEAIGTPTCVLFGPTVEAFGFAPWSPQSKNYSAPLGCRPCSKHGKIPCRFGDKKCFSDILLRPIAFALREHLRPTPEKLNASS